VVGVLTILVILLVVVRIAWVVLLLRLMMFVASLLVEHLIKEAAELGIDQRQQRQNSKKVSHFVDDLQSNVDVGAGTAGV
jgi:ABC-type bacteriocin/lantibiotic exporter with double-glycine peptidase domain